MIDFICPETKSNLSLKEDHYLSEEGLKYPIVNNIPRFVNKNNYALSFGLQWNKFRKTQLDSFTGTTLTRDRLYGICKGNLEIFNEKNVLEIGCGAGRFTEIMLQHHAKVWAVDLSNAVEANYKNFCGNLNYQVLQADLQKLPFKENTFDIVTCIGVIQHTLNPEETIKTLTKYIKPGGLLLIDHYAKDYPYTLSRKICRRILLFLPYRLRFPLSKYMVILMWPLHKVVWKISLRWVKSNRGERVRKFFLRMSPVVDYHTVYSALNNKQLFEWAILDTHDTLTDRYKHLRSVDEIKKVLLDSKMSEASVWNGGNGIEAYALK